MGTLPWASSCSMVREEVSLHYCGGGGGIKVSSQSLPSFDDCSRQLERKAHSQVKCGLPPIRPPSLVCPVVSLVFSSALTWPLKQRGLRNNPDALPDESATSHQRASERTLVHLQGDQALLTCVCSGKGGKERCPFG